MFFYILLGAAVIEIFVTVYTLAVAKGNITLATITSGAIAYTSSYLVIGFVEDHALILAVALGEMVGTAIALLSYRALRSFDK